MRKITRPTLSLSLSLALTIIVIFGQTSAALAATRTWTGGGAGSNMATAANWSGSVVPVTGDDLVFPQSASKTTVINNLAAGTRFNSLTISAGATPYSISGNGLQVASAIAVSGIAHLSLPVTLYNPGVASNVTFNTASIFSGLYLDGGVSGASATALHVTGAGVVNLTTGNASLLGSIFVDSGILRTQQADSLGSVASATTVGSGAYLDLAPTSTIILNENLNLLDGAYVTFEQSTNVFGGTITLTGTSTLSVFSGKTVYLPHLAGAGTFTKVGLGTIDIDGSVDNTFGTNALPVTVLAGTLLLDQTDGTTSHVALPHGLIVGGSSGTALVKLGSAASLNDSQIVGAVTINDNGTLDLNGRSNPLTTLTGTANGVLAMSGGTMSLTGGGSFAGNITGTTGNLVLQSGGTLLLTGSNTFKGQTYSSGTLQVEGILPAPGVVLLTGSELTGVGTVPTVLANHSTLFPATGSTPGVMKAYSVQMGNNSTFHVRAVPNGNNGLWSQLDVTSSVTLSDVTLTVDIVDGVQPHPGSSIILINNLGTQPVTGTFKGLPEGSPLTAGGLPFHISYVGGDGNDVVLTPVPMYYLSEGSTGGFFTTDVLVANPHDVPAPITATFYTQANGVVSKNYTVPPAARITLHLNTISEIGDGAVSTIVTSTSGLPLVVERTMFWDKSGYGASGDKAVIGPSTTWYFAEGSQGFFSTYVLLANPQTIANNATITYFREGSTPVVRTYALSPQSRTTVDVGADAALVGYSFGMQVNFDAPGVAERSMYFGTSPLWTGGHESAGVTQLSEEWLLAEGATGPFFETFILLANPGSSDANVTVTFMPAGGTPIVKTKTVAANSRLTINIEAEDPALSNAAVATQIQSSQPIIAERSQYWPDPAPNWYEAHNSFGVTEAAFTWGLAEGRVGQAAGFQTYILLQNPSSKDANVTILFMRENGGPTISKSFVVKSSGRLNVSGADVPELVDENFGAYITSDQPIAVERSMYSNTNGQLWAAGTNATATLLP